MKKIIAIIFFVIIICIGGFFFFKYSKNIKPFIASKLQVGPQNIKAEDITSSEENTKDNYKITISYPQFSGIKNKEASTKINADVKKYVDNIISKIKSPGQDGAVEMCNFSNLPGGAPSWQCEYNIALNSFDTVAEKILSVKMEYYWFTGGAHGGTNVEFLNYNLATGEKIDWKNLFKKDSNYLKVIADYARADLTKQLLQGPDQMSDENWIQTGTDPANKDNYKNNIGFSENGLSIIFGQYQVAAYAVGMPEVVVPYSQLKDVIDPAGLLSSVAK
jgi:uncharacterized protein YxeA